jgi:hypothetical protein
MLGMRRIWLGWDLLLMKGLVRHSDTKNTLNGVMILWSTT